MNDIPRRHILMVEDEPMLLEVVTADLEDAGFAVLQAGSAESALDLLKNGAVVDILFTDIRLPGSMDGWQLAEEARLLNPDLPIIYATGFSQTAPRPAEGGVFFTKPYRVSAIIRAIESLTPAAST